MYINVGKFYWKNGAKWLTTPTAYANAGTLLRMHTSSVGNNYVCARIHVTYYVQFKTPIIA